MTSIQHQNIPILHERRECHEREVQEQRQISARLGHKSQRISKYFNGAEVGRSVRKAYKEYPRKCRDSMFQGQKL